MNRFNSLKTSVCAGLLSLAAFAAPSFAAAPTFDTTDITDAITAGGVAAGLVAAAFVATYYGIKVWKLVKSAG